MRKKETRGGFRENAHRPQKYGEETRHVAFRVPVSKVQEFTDKVKNILESYIKSSKMNNDYRLQILNENFNQVEGGVTLKEYVETEAGNDPKFFNWFFGSDADNIGDFGKGMTEEQRKEYDDFLNSLN